MTCVLVDVPRLVERSNGHDLFIQAGIESRCER